MKGSLKFIVKQRLKMLLQNVLLPCAYGLWSFVYRKESPELIIFADSHHAKLPYSMERIHNELLSRGYDIVDEIYDFSSMSTLKSLMLSLRFMRLYARAKYVFICDNFLPVSSCKKREETIVVQLMHSCGLLKKMGYDTTDDIPKGYKGEVYRNYDLVTVSSPACIEPLQKAMHLATGVVKALGTSRTDNYFDSEWIRNCKEKFYKEYPELKTKKIILWAPTFRGNAAEPYLVGAEAIAQLEQALGEGVAFIKKIHPHADKKYKLSNCDIPTEELFPVVDLLISDYSSVVNEFMFFEKPYVLFAPDLEEYAKARGFYVPYDSLTPYVCTQTDKLLETIFDALADEHPVWVKEKRTFHLQTCDGKATESILEYLNL